MAKKKKKASKKRQGSNQKSQKGTTAVSPPAKRVSQRQRQQQRKAQAARMQQLRIIGFVAIGLLTLVALGVWRNAGRVPVDQLLAATLPNLDGSSDAPIKVVEYGDFGCHACRNWHNRGIKAQLKEKFGDNISFEFRHLPIITSYSPKAAEAGQCAAEQDQFWAYHDYIYESTPEGALRRDELKEYASAVGLDREAFDSCLDSGKYEDYVRTHQQEALSRGARGTPTFFVNEQPSYNLSYEDMAAQIEALLQG